MDARFSLEPCGAALVLSEHIAKKIDRDVPAELGVPSTIDLSHAPCPDEREDLVLQEALGRLQRHERLRLLRLERGFNPELP